MAVVNYFFSGNGIDLDRAYTAPSVSGNGNAVVGKWNAQTTSFASDCFELRISTGVTGFLTPTKRDALKFLRACERWIEDTGGGSDTGSGLDALIKANSGSVGVP